MSGQRGHDLNGRPVVAGRWGRVRDRFTRRRATADDPRPDDPDLRVVAASDDDAIASSVALAAGAFAPDRPAVVRHLLALPAARVGEAEAVAAMDRYRRVADAASATASRDGDGQDGGDGLVTVMFARVQRVDAVHLSQERSRMASLASRHGGRALAWQVLQA